MCAMTDDLLNEAQRTEQFRQLVSKQLTDQTKSLETIKTILILWVALGVLSGLFLIIAWIAAAESGY